LPVEDAAVVQYFVSSRVVDMHGIDGRHARADVGCIEERGVDVTLQTSSSLS